MKRSIYFLIMIFMVLLIAAGNLIVQRDRAVLRSGPGSWYDIVIDLPLGTQLTVLDNDIDENDSDQWIKVSACGKTGYISNSIIKKSAPKNNVFQSMAKQKTDLTASKHGVSAGVKGFGERFTKTFKGDPSFLEIAMKYKINPKEYKQFKKDTYKGFNLKSNKKQIKFPIYPKNEYFTFSEEGFGLGVASAIASQGLYKNESMHHYVNYIGTILAEASDMSDIEFKFFILNLDAPNAYACPGGYIFVTKGMIKQCENESELACVLSHEIIHVLYSHGMKELEKRKNNIVADQAFDEMDEELPTADKEVELTEKEMNDEAFSMYETVIQGRLDAYEQEADELGMVLAARAGYSPTSLSSLLSRLSKSSLQSNNQHYRKEIIQKRLNWVNSFLSKKKFPDNLFDKRDRFLKNRI